MVCKTHSALDFKGYSLNDYSLLFKKPINTISIITVYVDDMLLTENDEDYLPSLKIFLEKKFKIKDLG